MLINADRLRHLAYRWRLRLEVQVLPGSVDQGYIKGKSDVGNADV